jgi:hypothetical protein
VLLLIHYWRGKCAIIDPLLKRKHAIIDPLLKRKTCYYWSIIEEEKGPIMPWLRPWVFIYLYIFCNKLISNKQTNKQEKKLTPVTAASTTTHQPTLDMWTQLAELCLSWTWYCLAGISTNGKVFPINFTTELEKMWSLFYYTCTGI